MANTKQAGGELGFKKTYKMTGTPGFAGGPDQKVEQGASGSKRANNAVLNQNKVKSSKVGPDKSLKDLSSGNFY
jgi:hypothetical protein